MTIVAATIKMSVIVDQLLALGLDLGSNPQTTHTLDASPAAALTASTTPGVTKVFSDNLALSGGTGTIDLTNLAGPLGTTVTLDGLKPRLVMIVPSSANLTNLVVSPGASNGYNICGAASKSVSIHPGGAYMQTFHTGAGAIGSSAKTIDLTGGTTETYSILILAGP